MKRKSFQTFQQRKKLDVKGIRGPAGGEKRVNPWSSSHGEKLKKLLEGPNWREGSALNRARGRRIILQVKEG